MIKGETKTGFAFELEEAVLDNMELVDALAEMQEDDPWRFRPWYAWCWGRNARHYMSTCARRTDACR